MADKWPLANGVWSDAANWNGGALPLAGDDVYADGRTVTIDQDVTVASIRTTQRSGGTAGGAFTPNATRTINANIIAGTSNVITLTSTNLTVNGNITGGISQNANGINVTGVGLSIVVNGNLTGGSGAVSGNNTCAAVAMALGSAGASSILTVTGNVLGGSGNGGPGIITLAFAGATPIVFVTGNVTAGILGSGIAHGRGSVTVTGNVSGGVGPSVHGMFVNPGSQVTITINGDVYGGSVSSSRGLQLENNAGGTFVVNGNCIGGNAPSATGFVPSSTCTGSFSCVEAIASSQASGVSNGAIGLSCTVRRVRGTTGVLGVGGFFRFTNDADILLEHLRVGESAVTLTDVTQVAGLLPAVGNVRQGTTYNAGGLTGTLAVPNPNQVAVGVATDNTVGTAVITESAIRAAIGLVSANLDTQLATKPTLAQIEASTVLAKSADITSLQNNAPSEAF